uniref:Uncharacterized protein n=1 Tax=Rhizophora mucronata TaxID=61149 RepID=A0A2P2QWV5_RHIMU
MIFLLENHGEKARLMCCASLLFQPT